MTTKLLLDNGIEVISDEEFSDYIWFYNKCWGVIKTSQHFYIMNF
jgi:hypothetical protein